MNIREIIAVASVIPVVTVSNLAHAVPLAQALVSGGLRAIEIDLRTTAAIGSIEAIRKAVPAAIIGAGTLTRAADFAAAGRAGAQFGASPGFTPELAAAARGARFPLLPGVMTPSEVISARHAGFDILKLFPAHQAGVSMLQSLIAPFPDVSFCAAGGITQANASEYLALPNVVCVFSSWIVPEALMQSGDWEGIEARAREGAGLKTAAWLP
jgi:2-dehydro-3-deoxyphosphogluconate aldolase / (4S)-4-hydroxy-2-oxoglutarate aldolase